MVMGFQARNMPKGRAHLCDCQQPNIKTYSLVIEQLQKLYGLSIKERCMLKGGNLDTQPVGRARTVRIFLPIQMDEPYSEPELQELRSKRYRKYIFLSLMHTIYAYIYKHTHIQESTID